MKSVGVHNNAHVPKESFPNWIWFIIELAIVLATALLLANEITPAFEEMVITQDMECHQKSHIVECKPGEGSSPDEGILNWIFWSIVGGIFFGWYYVIRSKILKKPILGVRN